MKTRKIVAIGGGENGRIKSDGTPLPYETAPQDKEIIRLTGKARPNFLFLAHSQPPEAQDGYFAVMQKIYGVTYGCECRHLKSEKLDDAEYVKTLVDRADIIYEGGGNTPAMIALWKKTGFDSVLRSAWEDGKVMCGVSAGANCWFEEYQTSARENTSGESCLSVGEGLGFVKGFFVPHAEEPERASAAPKMILESGKIGYLVSSCAALEIVGGEYRVITSDAAYHGIAPFAKRAFLKDGAYFEETLDLSGEYLPLCDLYGGK